jgi:hypothetical protein
VDSTGAITKDPAQAARREAMIDLANFQHTGLATHLSAAILHACLYAKVDLVDMTLNIPDDMFDNLDVDIPPHQLVDDAAVMLFKSLNAKYSFDIYEFAAALYSAEHLIINQHNESETDGDTHDK